MAESAMDRCLCIYCKFGSPVSLVKLGHLLREIVPQKPHTVKSTHAKRKSPSRTGGLLDNQVVQIMS